MIRIGSATRRSIIAVYLDPEEADDMAALYGPSDRAFEELIDAAKRARIELGEES